MRLRSSTYLSSLPEEQSPAEWGNAGQPGRSEPGPWRTGERGPVMMMLGHDDIMRIMLTLTWVRGVIRGGESVARRG